MNPTPQVHGAALAKGQQTFKRRQDWKRPCQLRSRSAALPVDLARMPPSAMSTSSIPQGQMVGIIGRSGAGKSTLLRMINRLIDPSQGSIFFDGAEVSKLQGAAAAALAARLRHDLPAVQPGAAPRRADQCAARPAQPPLDHVQPARHVFPRRMRRGDRARSSGSTSPAPRCSGRHAFRRPAAARRHRPRHDAAAQGDPRRRADRLARSAQRQDRDGLAAGHQCARRHHRHHQSAHARYRPHLLQPHHRHGRRQGRLRRPAGGTRPRGGAR